MKITHAQYFKIEEFFSDKCRLVETEFIEEMTDHFMDSIEAKMAELIPFDKAMDSTIADFGGVRAIQKMEWQYRKGFIKKQLGVLWALKKSQFSKQKIRRSAMIMIMISLTALCIYICLFAKNNPYDFDFKNGFIIGAAILPAVTLPAFFLQRRIKWLSLFGTVNSHIMVRVYSTFSLLTALFLMIRAISVLGFPILIIALLYSIIWTIFALSFVSILEYSKKYEAGYWYQTR